MSDVRGARPAGRLFDISGKLYRPAQICSPRYGYGIAINRVTKLTECDYEEHPATSIEPDWHRDLVATHTISSAGELTVLDGRLASWRWKR